MYKQSIETGKRADLAHTMQKLMIKLFLAVIATALVVPESYAKRMGGGRSAGRQSQMSRQRALPPPSVARARPAQPAAVPQSPPNASRPGYGPGAPAQAQQPARSRLGGILGGAALGLGLGSVLSSGNAREAAGQEAARAEAAAQEAARLEEEQRKSASGVSGAGAEQPAEKPPVSGNW